MAAKKSAKAKKRANKKKAAAVRRFSLYVIELDPAVRDVKRFREANPDARLDKPCLYVGMTALTPEARFERHKLGIQAGRRIATRFGVRLRKRYYEKLNPLTQDEAKVGESALAARLRKRGFAVWQN
jgi:hypothetical protein